MTSLAARHRRRRTLAAAREVAVVALAAVVYTAVRALTKGDLHEAQENGRRILNLERALHIDWESAVQSFVLAHPSLTELANWIYIWGFWPVLAGTAVFLYGRHRGEYFRLRNAVFISALIGFAFFALLPVAPPRLVDPHLVDTITDHTGWYRTLLPPSAVNEYAAMPSLHVGWSLLVGVAIARAIGPRAYAIGMVVPVAMTFAVLATANHYVADVLVGSGVALTALLLASRPRRLDRLSAAARPKSADRRRAAAPPTVDADLIRTRTSSDEGATSSVRPRHRGSLFDRFARGCARFAGHPVAFAAAGVLIALWLVSGPVFGFSDTWQLVVNTATTIVTFLMVFVIQNTQNRDGAAIQIKLDELIRAVAGADNGLLDLEELSETEIEAFRKKYGELGDDARAEILRAQSYTGSPDVHFPS